MAGSWTRWLVAAAAVVLLTPVAACASTAGFYDQLSTAAGEVASASGSAAEAIDLTAHGRLTSAVRDSAIADADQQSSTAAGTLDQLQANTTDRQASRRTTIDAVHRAQRSLQLADDAAANHDDQTLARLAPTLREQAKQLTDLQDEWASR
ncbi:hypothetical protein [Aestuariimicrobium kwangyangense]|uniref:hypothetical protein n=1 Tax=Aestuariimicrobium kwangyangense TaxID=396389 RepID=UPI0003B53D67|nr:hypothetical protein [Aestuariimicrobium kwangyangense]